MICFLILVLTLSAYGCFSSRERGDDDASVFDGADVSIATYGTSGKDTPNAGSGGINGGNTRVGGGIVKPLDAAIIDVVVQGGTGGGGGTGGIDTDDDAETDDAPCEPNCPVLDWITIQGGTFMMGSAEGTGDDDEHPQHEVTVQSIKMSKTEVTVTQYLSCVEAGICSEPLGFSETGNWGKLGRENHPINAVDWLQAREFAQWLGGRLPSEVEWEYAARSGGQDIVYLWGNEEASCEYAVFGGGESENVCGNETTAEVCGKPLGNTAQGLCDMAGNVWEWIEDDWHDSYSGAPRDSQAWIDSPRSNLRVLRGGSWFGTPDGCRSATRVKCNPVLRNDDCGFRVVLDLK